MNEVLELLTKNPVQYLATIGLDNLPKVRPFQFMFEDDGKLFFCTSNQKDVYAELNQHPNIELCIASDDFRWIRLNGKVVFTTDLALKEKAICAS